MDNKTMYKAQTTLDAIYKDTERVGHRLNSFNLQVIASRNHFVKTLCNNKNVVEFGPGSIIGKASVLKLAKKYTAVEIHPTTAIELAEEIKSLGTVLNEDCCNTSLPDKCCDLVTALAMIYYTNFEKLVQEASRILQKNGKLVFCMPNKLQPNFIAAPGSTKYFNPNEIVQICIKSGFKVEVFGAYKFKSVDKKNTNFMTKLFSVLFKRMVKIIEKISPNLYLYLRAFKFGKVSYIPNNLDELQNYEIPTQIDPTLENKYRMFYFIAEKSK